VVFTAADQNVGDFRPPPLISHPRLDAEPSQSVAALVGARVGIRQVSGNLDKVYDELDSDIDDLKKVVDNPPTDPKTVQFLLQKISDKWPTKLKLIEELAVNSLQQMGCPMQLAATP
jgi:hypothetical protein